MKQFKRKAQEWSAEQWISTHWTPSSPSATASTQYALRSSAIRGYVIDKKRMENGLFIGEDYFEQRVADV